VQFLKIKQARVSCMLHLHAEFYAEPLWFLFCCTKKTIAIRLISFKPLPQMVT